MTDPVPPLALTMGEPAGVGPTLAARLWRDRRHHSLPEFCFYGDSAALHAVDPDLPVLHVATPEEATTVFDRALPVMPLPLGAPVVPGQLNPLNGPGVIAAIDRAVADCRAGRVSGVVTAPIHKKALYDTGFDAPGHTEYLARLCGMADEASIMMLMAADLKVVPVTIHIPLKDVADRLTVDGIVHAGRVLHRDLKHRFALAAPRLALAGLNPHAGEGGGIGEEESRLLAPAVARLRGQGVDITDPQSADTLFHPEARTQYDAALCMYHDQALIPVKTIDFWGGVNVTLGLPVIRTSPDHGTALNLAGSSAARPESLLAAIRAAHMMAVRSAGRS
ncbi:4-hydroxythreonine-4-phosphate dehydrogenase PdxA [Yunchengibacter salinarum]|uniref:4-hydroxythreonine-4-phosphate dehydrogenase PdxA n=1 Tax=Yunchengibacter salinarum TaxID=3133399 RepID=UPI0035B5BCFA